MKANTFTAQQKLILLITILASFVTFLDGTVVNVALPAIVHELHGGLVTQQWVVDAYLITLGSLILAAGSLSDLLGRKRILSLGLIGFGAASLLCAIAPSGLFLIISRGLQGVFGALLVPSSLALLISAFPNKQQEGRAIGLWTSWTGIAAVAGPLLGGFLVDTFSWRWIFAINVLPICVTLMLMTRCRMTEVQQKIPIDVRGAVLCTIGLGAPVFALIEQSRYGWTSSRIYLPLVVGAALFAAFLWHERRAKNPMLPLSLFKVRNFRVGNWATLAIYGGLASSAFLITIFVQQVGGYTALQAGLTSLPVTIFMFTLSSRFGALAGRFGPRFFMAVGPLLAAAGFLTMLRTQVPVVYWTQLLPGVALFGLGLALTVAPLTAAVLGSVQAQHAGIASAVSNAVARVAGLIVVASIGVITGSTMTLAGFHRGLIATAGLLAVGGMISAIGIQNVAKRPPLDLQESREHKDQN